MKLRTGHVSMQFKDSDKQHSHDIEKIFAHAVDRRWAWVTGTEAGPGAGNTGQELVRVAREADYRPWVPEEQAKSSGRATDCWIAVREDLVDSNWEQGFEPAIPGSSQLYEEAGMDKNGFPKWGPKGLVRVGFDNDRFGRFNVGAAHYLTGARSPSEPDVKSVDHWKWNKKLAGVIGDWAKEVGKGNGLAFYAGDQNMADSKNYQPQGDTFMGEPLTSLADELKKWRNTGPGPVDIIASYNKDGRVTGQDFVVLDDKDFFLNTDHFLLEGTYLVEPLTS